MKVIKVINNSFVLAINNFNEEVVVMGKGIGFNYKVGQMINDNHIEKVFSLKNNTSIEEYASLLEKAPQELIDSIKQLEGLAKDKYQIILDDQIYITLLDHLIFALERQKNNQVIQNKMTWEIKKFYPQEYALASIFLSVINEDNPNKLSDNEIGNIAFHIINASQSSPNLQISMYTIKILKDIYNIIQIHFKINIKEDSLNYARFITHIQYFVSRALDNQQINDESEFIYKQLIKEYPQVYECTLLIKIYIEKLLKITLSNNEMTYLIIHIARIIKDNE